MKGMLTCKDASRLASKALDTPLSWRERWGLRIHLLLCTLCRRYVRELKFLSTAFRRARTDGIGLMRPKLSEAARSRIQKAVSGTEQE